MKQKIRLEKVRSIICLLLGGVAAYAFGRRSSWPFGLLILILSIASALLPAYFFEYIQRKRDELRQPIKEQLRSLPTMCLFKWLCQREDAERFAGAEIIAKEHRQYHGIAKLASLSQVIYAVMILMLQIFVWHYTAAWMIRILGHSALPVLAGLAVVGCFELYRWVRYVYRPWREIRRLWAAIEVVIINMPAEEAHKLLQAAGLVSGDQ